MRPVRLFDEYIIVTNARQMHISISVLFLHIVWLMNALTCRDENNHLQLPSSLSHHLRVRCQASRHERRDRYFSRVPQKREKLKHEWSPVYKNLKGTEEDIFIQIQGEQNRRKYIQSKYLLNSSAISVVLKDVFKTILVNRFWRLS